MAKVLLIDGNSLVYRGYYATAYRGGTLLQTRAGIYTNALFSFAKMLLKALQKFQPSHILVAFDYGKKTHRHDLFAAYKGGRSKTPPELIMQFPLIKELLQKMGIQQQAVAGWEADDIIATFSVQIPTHVAVEIMTSDRDLYQLVNEHVTILVNKRGVSEVLTLNAQNFEAELGYTPAQVIDIKALAGDSSDNLQGVKGIGEKGAIKLIKQYGSLENIYENITALSPNIQTKLRTDQATAFLCQKMVTLNQTVTVDLKWEQLRYTPTVTQSLLDFLEKYELKSLINQFQANGSAQDEAQQETFGNIIL